MASLNDPGRRRRIAKSAAAFELLLNELPTQSLGSAYRTGNSDDVARYCAVMDDVAARERDEQDD